MQTSRLVALFGAMPSVVAVYINCAGKNMWSCWSPRDSLCDVSTGMSRQASPSSVVYANSASRAPWPEPCEHNLSKPAEIKDI